MGIEVGGTASIRIAACVAAKARNVRKGRRAQELARSWLVLVEEVVIVHAYLGEEWSDVEYRLRCCEGIDQWNKVVLLSRYTGEHMAVYELSGEPPLA